MSPELSALLEDIRAKDRALADLRDVYGAAAQIVIKHHEEYERQEGVLIGLRREAYRLLGREFLPREPERVDLPGRRW